MRFDIGAESGGDEFYLFDRSAAVPPNATATDEHGLGGFFNLPTGVTVLRAFHGGDDAFVGEGSFEIQSEGIAYVHVGPTPQ